MRQTIKKLAGLSLAVLALIQTLTGCSAESLGNEKESQKEIKNEALGRYLEEEIKLPEGTKIVFDLIQMEDQSLRTAVGGEDENVNGIWKTSDMGSNWEKVSEFPQEIFNDTMSINSFCLLTDGSAFAEVYDYSEADKDPDNASLKRTLWKMNEEGKAAQIPAEIEENVMFINLTAAGSTQVAASASDGKVYLIDTASNEIKTFETSDTYCYNAVVVSNTLLALTSDEIMLFDINTGKTLTKDEVLEKELLSDGQASGFQSGSVSALLSPASDGQGIYYCNSKGLFNHSFQGTVSEELIDGDLTSLSNPQTGLSKLIALADGSFLVYCLEQNRQPVIYHYIYSKETPSVPGTEVKAYSLKDNDEIRQAIALYQKKNPDVRVTLEVGISQEDGATVSDALKTLNTNILSGNGPDVLFLDGISVKSYLDKGLLEDLTGIAELVDKTDGVQEGAMNCYRKDGKIYAIPTRLSIPLIQGTKEVISDIRDLNTLVEKAQQLKKENPDKKILGKELEFNMLDNLYDVCSAAWVSENGSLDQKKLTDYMELLKTLYDLDEHSDVTEDGIKFSSQGWGYGIGNTLMNYYGGNMILNFGNVSSMEVFGELTSINSSLKNENTFHKLDGQAANVFVPGTIAGISTKAANPEEAKKFVSFLLSKEVQSAVLGSGFPVNEAALERVMENNTMGEAMIMSTVDEEGNVLELQMSWPKKDEIEALKNYIKEAKTPAYGEQLVKETVTEFTKKCLKGEISADEAVKEIMQKVNLYLSE